MGRHELVLRQAVKAPPTALWAILADLKRYPEWMSHVTKVTGPAAANPKRGSKFTVTTQVGSHELVTDMLLSHFEAEKLMTWEHLEERLDGTPTGMVSDARSEFVLEPAGKGTRLQATLSFVAHGLKAKLGAALFLNSRVKPQLEESLRRLAERAERQA